MKRKLTLILIAGIIILLPFTMKTSVSTVQHSNSYVLYYFEATQSKTTIVVFERIAYAFFPENRSITTGTFLKICSYKNKTYYNNNYMLVGTKWYWSSPNFYFTFSSPSYTVIIGGTTWMGKLKKVNPGQFATTANGVTVIVTTSRNTLLPVKLPSYLRTSP